MERVLWPMEPVEPRIASLFTSFIFAERCGLVRPNLLVGGYPAEAFLHKTLISEGFQVDLSSVGFGIFLRS